MEPGLVAPVSARLEEVSGRQHVPELRSAWSRPGWYEAASAWIGQMLTAEGHDDPVTITQYRHWGISAVMRVDAADERWWFKAAFPPFDAEPAISRFVHRAAPEATGSIVATNDDERWLLIRHLDGALMASHPDMVASAVERLVDVQDRCAGREEELDAIGCPRRPLAALPDRFAEVVDRSSVRRWLTTRPDQIERALSMLTEAVEQVESLGIADRLVHGDFHPGNVMLTDEGARIFDWSDAAIAHPIVDVVTWASWFRDDQPRVDRLWSTFRNTWLERWGIDIIGIDQCVLEAVAGAHHVVSYATIVDGLEPHREIESADGLTDFFALVDAVA